MPLLIYLRLGVCPNIFTTTGYLSHFLLYPLGTCPTFLFFWEHPWHFHHTFYHPRTPAHLFLYPCTYFFCPPRYLLCNIVCAAGHMSPFNYLYLRICPTYLFTSGPVPLNLFHRWTLAPLFSLPPAQLPADTCPTFITTLWTLVQLFPFFENTPDICPIHFITPGLLPTYFITPAPNFSALLGICHAPLSALLGTCLLLFIFTWSPFIHKYFRTFSNVLK